MSPHWKNGICKVQICQREEVTSIANLKICTAEAEGIHTWGRQRGTGGRGGASRSHWQHHQQKCTSWEPSTANKSTSDSTHSQVETLQDSIFFLFSGGWKSQFHKSNKTRYLNWIKLYNNNKTKSSPKPFYHTLASYTSFFSETELLLLELWKTGIGERAQPNQEQAEEMFLIDSVEETLRER